MNAIHQISLKLQLGIDPAAKVAPSTLRAMWQAQASRRLGRPSKAATTRDAGGTCDATDARDAVGRAIGARGSRS